MIQTEEWTIARTPKAAQSARSPRETLASATSLYGRHRGGSVNLRVRDVLSLDPVRIHMDASLRDAAELASTAGVSELMVVDARGRFVGVLAEGDLIRALLPTRDDILADGGVLADAMASFVRRGHAAATRAIRPLVTTDVITLDLDDDIAKAAVGLTERHVGRLPVVRDGVLVGTVSRADICGVLYAVAVDR
jgi:CBS domain-containing protein